MSRVRGLKSGRGQPMQVVLQVAKTEETEAARELARLRDNETAAKAQLEQLLQFLDQYSSRPESVVTPAGRPATPKAIQPALLGNRHAFVDRLMAALKVQHTRQVSIAQDVERQRAHWLALQARRRAVERLIARERAAQREIAERREQAALDFSATRGTASVGVENSASAARLAGYGDGRRTVRQARAEDLQK